MAVNQPLDNDVQTNEGQFRVVTQRGGTGFTTTVYRRLPDGPHTPVYEEAIPTPEGAQAAHERILQKVKAGQLP